jgi:threonine synthase
MMGKKSTVSEKPKIHWIQTPRCTGCGTTYEEPVLRCPRCHSLIVIPPTEGIAKVQPTGFWNFQSFLPHFSRTFSMNEGGTPVYHLRNYPGLKNLPVKLEFRNPTGSFRDRASSLIISDALHRQFSDLVVASTGSFGTSLAAYAAGAGLTVINFMPRNIDLAKIEQLKVYGSQVQQTGETMTEAAQSAEEYTQTHPCYLPLPTQNLLMIEGQKTIALELTLQHPHMQSIILPRGSGSLIYSVYRGLQDALASGWIPKIPEIISVTVKPRSSTGLVESLDFSETLLAEEVPKILNQTHGQEISIDPDIMIEDALKLAKTEGLFIEPGSASVIAAAQQLVKDQQYRAEDTVAILSGSGMNALNIYAGHFRDLKKVVWGLSSTSTKKLEILNLIAENKATNGSGIWHAIGKKQSIQSVYQHLTELEEKGLIESENVDKRTKKYTITNKGKKMCETMKDLIDIL